MMGKFSDRINRLGGRRKEPVPNWDRAGEAIKYIIALSAHDEATVVETLTTQRAAVQGMLENIRTVGQAMLGIADRGQTLLSSLTPEQGSINLDTLAQPKLKLVKGADDNG
ncbi:hypothetical protein ACE10X_07000 [Bradyrhizobium sp. Pha-3]|uniref:hypothetical protein n=1 Tax=Bradyrhizobium sp. Pha-3 TaxID=208375 RepID=UPI0035D4A6B3